jgi:hypothetical protein
MRQLNDTFIDFHLTPLLKEILTDVVRDPQDYHKDLITYGVLNQREKQDFEKKYFLDRRNAAEVPFTRDSEKQERQDFMDYFAACVKNISADPVERFKALQPLQDETNKDQFTWPAVVERNIFLMAYDIAGKFEKAKNQELIDLLQKIDPLQADKDQQLNERDLLMLIKNPETGNFDHYLKKEQRKKMLTVTPFITKPSAKTKALMEGISEHGGSSSYGKNIDAIPDKKYSTADLEEDFKNRRTRAIRKILADQGLTFIENPEVKDGKVMATVLSGTTQVQVTIDIKTPLDDDMQYQFRFLNGPNIGQEFSVFESRLDELFQASQGEKRTLEAVYKFLESEKSATGMDLFQAGKIHLPEQSHFPLQAAKNLPSNQNVINKNNLNIPATAWNQKAETPLQQQFPPKKDFDAPSRFEQPESKKGMTFEKSPMAQKAKLRDKLRLEKSKVTAAAPKATNEQSQQKNFQAQLQPNFKREFQIQLNSKPPKQGFLKRFGPALAATVTGAGVLGTMGATGIIAYFS